MTTSTAFIYHESKSQVASNRQSIPRCFQSFNLTLYGWKHIIVPDIYLFVLLYIRKKRWALLGLIHYIPGSLCSVRCKYEFIVRHPKGDHHFKAILLHWNKYVSLHALMLSPSWRHELCNRSICAYECLFPSFLISALFIVLCKAHEAVEYILTVNIFCKNLHRLERKGLAMLRLCGCCGTSYSSL